MPKNATLGYRASPKFSLGSLSLRRTQISSLSTPRDASYFRRDAGSSASSSGRGDPQGATRSVESTYAQGLVKLVTGSRGREIDMEMFGPSPHDCRRLTARLKQAPSWLELRDLLPKASSSDAKWSSVDTICLTAALSALARCAARTTTTKPLLTVAAASSSMPLPQLPPAATLSRAAFADAANRAEISEAASALLAFSWQRLSEFDAQGIVTVAVSVAKLRAAGLSDSWVSVALPDTLFTGFPGTFDKEQQAVTILYTQLLHHSGYVLHRFTPQALANLVWALATVGHQPCGRWLTEYYRRLEDQLPVLKSQDVANILWSLCKLDLMPDIWLRDGLVERALESVRDPVLTVASGQDPATLIQCLARWYYLYNYRVSDEWLGEYLALVQPRLGACMPFDLVSMAHSCVVMNFSPCRSWMADYYGHIMHSLKFDPTLSYSDFQRLMWALSRVDTPPSSSWQREFVAVSIPKLRHLKIRALSEFIWALACWDCRPSPKWLAEYFTVTHPRLADARPQHISCQLSALAKLGLTAPGPWLDEALRSFCEQLPEAKAHDLVTLLYSITTVCVDRSWLLGHTSTIKRLADTASSKFSVYDPAMHTKLCVALAAANVCPAADWLAKQQAALVACLRGGEPVGQGVVKDLMEVYRTWDVEVEADLRWELSAPSYDNSRSDPA